MERLKATVNRELTSIEDARDELAVEGVDDRRTESFVQWLAAQKQNKAYTASHDSPTPMIDLVGHVFSRIVQGPETQRCLHPKMIRFLETHVDPFRKVAQQPTARETRVGLANGQACALAESTFNTALQQVRRRRFGEHARISAYHDDEGVPLLFRKTAYERTALTLVAFRTRDFAIPPGTIAGVLKENVTEPTGRKKHKSFALESWPWSDRDILQPLRLSPWAYEDAEERALFACEGFPLGEEWLEYDRYRADMVKRTSLEDYTAVAQRIMELCAA